MWKYTDDAKVGTQVHWEPREDALPVIAYPRSSEGGKDPDKLKLSEQKEAGDGGIDPRMVLTNRRH